MAGNAQRGSLLCSLADPATGKALPVAGGRLVRAGSRERRHGRQRPLGNMVVFSPRLNRRVETRFVRGVLVSRLAFSCPAASRPIQWPPEDAGALADEARLASCCQVARFIPESSTVPFALAGLCNARQRGISWHDEWATFSKATQRTRCDYNVQSSRRPLPP